MPCTALGDEAGGDQRVDVGAERAVGDAVDDHLLPAVEDLGVGLDQRGQILAVADLRPAVVEDRHGAVVRDAHREHSLRHRPQPLPTGAAFRERLQLRAARRRR